MSLRPIQQTAPATEKETGEKIETDTMSATSEDTDRGLEIGGETGVGHATGWGRRESAATARKENTGDMGMEVEMG